MPGGGGCSALALSEDHKPSAPAETQRALAAGADVAEGVGDNPTRIGFDYAPSGSAMSSKMAVRRAACRPLCAASSRGIVTSMPSSSCCSSSCYDCYDCYDCCINRYC